MSTPRVALHIIQHAGRNYAHKATGRRQNIDRLKLDYDAFIIVHAPNPDRPFTRADVQALTRGTN